MNIYKFFINLVFISLGYLLASVNAQDIGASESTRVAFLFLIIGIFCGALLQTLAVKEQLERINRGKIRFWFLPGSEEYFSEVRFCDVTKEEAKMISPPGVIPEDIIGKERIFSPKEIFSVK